MLIFFKYNFLSCSLGGMVRCYKDLNFFIKIFQYNLIRFHIPIFIFSDIAQLFHNMENKMSKTPGIYLLIFIVWTFDIF